MSTDRRKFLSLLALGAPATSAAIRKGFATCSDIDEERDVAIPMEIVLGATAQVEALANERDGHVRVVRRDNAAGKIRWTVEIAEPDTSSNTILGRHPSVLLVCSKSLQVLYGICLEQAGCRVQYARDHNAAMRLYCEHGPYDLVLADFLRFRELFTRIRKNDSEQH